MWRNILIFLSLDLSNTFIFRLVVIGQHILHSVFFPQLADCGFSHKLSRAVCVNRILRLFFLFFLIHSCLCFRNLLKNKATSSYKCEASTLFDYMGCNSLSFDIYFSFYWVINKKIVALTRITPPQCRKHRKKINKVNNDVLKKSNRQYLSQDEIVCIKKSEIYCNCQYF